MVYDGLLVDFVDLYDASRCSNLVHDIFAMLLSYHSVYHRIFRPCLLICCYYPAYSPVYYISYALRHSRSLLMTRSAVHTISIYEGSLLRAELPVIEI